MTLHQQTLTLPPYRYAYVRSVLRRIDAMKPSLEHATDAQLREKSLELKFLAKSGEPVEKLVAPAFAIVQEAAFRTLGMRHFEVQLIAGINLVSKCVVEMATGEGKTLTAALPLYLYGLFGKGAQLATANDYLASRDATEMRPVFELLGMSVGVVEHDDSDEQRMEAYARDVTYGTLAEFGFDFLRDRMKRRAIDSNPELASQNIKSADTHPVCRRLHFILVDEADSIMIDDASTPLIIGAFSSKNANDKTRLYRWAAKHAPAARAKIDYRYIEHQKKAELTEQGRTWVRSIASTSDVADQATVDAYEYIERAIRVERDYVRDRNYVIKDNQATIVDENTGRLAIGRFWQDGLHQAIQAREGLEITMPTASAARLTVQSLVLSFPNRAGMTGTARPSRREFRKVYKMRVIRIPTRRPNARRKLPTVFRPDERSKMLAIRDSVLRLNQQGRPVLIGSRSVAKSELLSEVFHDAGVEHEVLNARHEASEAAIVARAGERGSVIISTSMAGRGTDIKLLPEVKQIGGLHVLITELNDSPRIDRQLIGRCGRQGDPGTFQYFLSLDDHVMDVKNKTQRWARLVRLLPVVPSGFFFQRAQSQINAKNLRNRLAMLHHEKRRLRDLRQAGLDPVLDVVG